MTNQNEKELTMTRVFDASCKIMFHAWTDATLMAQWWGPKGFTNPVCEMDAVPGGAIRIEMQRPDGVVYPMKGIFQDIIEPERLVFTSTAFEDDEGSPRLEALTTVTFADQDGNTKLMLHAVVVKFTQEATDAVNGMEEGWSQSLDRLAEIFHEE